MSTESYTIYDNGNLTTIAYVFDRTIRDCTKMTVHINISMKAGTKNTDWTLWCRVNGEFKKVDVIYLPGGDGETSQTIIFDDPLTFDAIIVTPKAVGGYSWSQGVSVTDIWEAQ